MSDPWSHTRPVPNQPLPGNPYATPPGTPTTPPTSGGFGPPRAPGPQGFGAPTAGPYNTPAPQTVAARNPYMPSMGDKALKVLKRAGKLSLGLSPAIAIAGGMLANEPGMASAVSAMDSGMSSRLDDGIKQLLPQLLNASRDGWIAMDRDEFEKWIWTFHREIGALRNVISKGSGMLDEVAASYRSFWTWIIRMSFAAIGLLVIAKGLQRVPTTSVWGLLLERYITAEVNVGTLFLATSVASTLKEGGDVLSTMVKKDHQFGYVVPGGDAAIDFKSITIDAKEYPSFAEPAKNSGLPPRYQDFDWIEPKRSKPTPAS
ncbi:hypothetical protein SAMN05444920_11345 [Nonomuraea solani]|uniref:Uncharacterized protein n=1 Tax=Nonomuraea solani TaxID=1144553 RepID=A0A1H6ENN8_9ACTN|nr:hypothetical protein [Nonomuraea solani]SEG99442.1 hypothetical protein SAMN05444920_11345 [Nonomuraea solani]